jgi:hypothetical protein
MRRVWPIIAIADVPRSAQWYVSLLGDTQSRPAGKVFDQILSNDRGGEVSNGLLMVIMWPSMNAGGNLERMAAEAPRESNFHSRCLLTDLDEGVS